ncbi:WSC-domain-containing protein [Hypoxylon cercidicola]|nr:WSC-domain-containing protein [Hypoxylon cercidicola]
MATLRALLSTLIVLPGATAYWRMSCGLIQTGRLDPNISPGAVSAHVHKVSGASNFGLSNTYEDLLASRCTSCEVQDDKSAYWTPQLYYERVNGSFEEVPNGGTVVYYLGRGENRPNIEPFPPGFRMVSGDPFIRSNDTVAVTYSDGNFRSRPISDRVSFACLDSSGTIPEENYMFRTQCNEGMRAQIHFQSCWDGRDYQLDQSHVAYLSDIDNGICPPSHPRQLPHLFFEVIYGVADVKQEPGGRFVFANGDPTGFGFHGDFMNGWEVDVLKEAVDLCLNDDSFNGQISHCPPLAKSQTPYYATNCPERQPIVDEEVKGMLECLPGCNVVTLGPDRAVPLVCPDDSPSVHLNTDEGPFTMLDPSMGQTFDTTSFIFVGCMADTGNPRTLSGASSAADNMTNEICVSFCKEKGYPFAGLEYSRECYCGSSIGSATASDCSTIPKMICAGDNTQWCGAPNLLTVWNDTSYWQYASTLEVDTTTINNGSATYLGCFNDPGGNSRALDGDNKFDTGAMTNEMCASYCSAKGFSLAGTEYSQECYCGNTISSTRISDDGQCNMKCKGDVLEVCGGGNLLSVWNLTLPQFAQDQTQSTQENETISKAAGGTAIYSGCYTDSVSAGRTLAGDSYFSDSMTVDSCASYCQSKNYALFGLEYGQECYCSNILKSSTILSADGACNMVCKGDSNQVCGGSSRLSVYNSTLYVPTRHLSTVSEGDHAYHHLGCYTEGTSGRALGRGTSAASASDSTTDAAMTVEKCASYCAGKGYSYMGVEYGRECYCNDEGLLNGAIRASEGDCDMVCVGDITEFCGGSSRINIYGASSA